MKELLIFGWFAMEWLLSSHRFPAKKSLCSFFPKAAAVSSDPVCEQVPPRSYGSCHFGKYTMLDVEAPTS